MAANRHLIIIFIAMSTIALAQSDLVPFPACFLLELAFKSLGCADGSGTPQYCEYMALALRLQLDSGEGLCTAFPCTGYGTSGRTCSSMFPRSCSSSNRIGSGVCPLGKECCNE